MPISVVYEYGDSMWEMGDLFEIMAPVSPFLISIFICGFYLKINSFLE